MKEQSMPVYLRDPQTGRKCKKGQPGVWYYNFTIKGRRYRRAIPEAQNKTQALAVEAQVKTAVFNGTYGPKESGLANFSEFVLGEYMKWAKDNKKSWRFDHFCAPKVARYFKGQRFCDMTAKAVEAYRDKRLSEITQRGTKRNGNSVCRELAMISKIFVLAIKKGYCEDNPVKKVDWPAQPNQRNRVVSDAEEQKILAAMSGRYERLRPVFIVALYTGMRRGELCSLRWSDIDFEKEVIRLRATVTKNGKARQIPLIEPAKTLLIEMRQSRADEEPEDKTFPMSKSLVSIEFRELMSSLNMRDVTLHTLRHTYASRAARVNMPPVYVQQILGHQHLDMTAYYSHSDREDLVREAKKMEKSFHLSL